MDTIGSLRTELHARKGEWPALCESTGLSYWWLTKFAQGRIREPGLSKIERLQRYFAERPLPDSSEDDPPSHRAPAAEGESSAEATEPAAALTTRAA